MQLTVNPHAQPIITKFIIYFACLSFPSLLNYPSVSVKLPELNTSLSQGDMLLSERSKTLHVSFSAESLFSAMTEEVSHSTEG